MTDDLETHLLVTHLLSIDQMSVEDCFCQSTYFIKAANRLVTLAAERNSLRDEVAITDKLLLQEAKVSLQRLERAEVVEVERDRLWKALRYYAEFHEDPNDGPWGVNSQDCGKVARAALRGEDYAQ